MTWQAQTNKLDTACEDVSDRLTVIVQQSNHPDTLIEAVKILKLLTPFFDAADRLELVYEVRNLIQEKQKCFQN